MSRVITKPNFHSIPGAETKTYLDVCPVPSANSSKTNKFYAQCTISLYTDVLYDLVPFVQFKKREKHLWRCVTFSKVAGLKPLSLPKVTLPHGCFSCFLNCTNGTKLQKTEVAINT